MIRVVREDIQGVRVIKALSKDSHEKRRYDTVNRTLSAAETHAGVTMGLVHPVVNVFMNMGSVTVIALGANYIAGGTSTPETIIAFIQYFTQISMALMAVSRMFVMYSKASASAKRIQEVLLAPEQIQVESKQQYPDRETDAHIVFDRVCFSYNKKRNDLENISFTLKKGDRLGIIGATGSGKSTLVKLLLRFYDTDCGNIYINGQNVRTIEKEDLYAQFGTSLQQDFLYADTIEENIKFGRPIADEQVRQAARLAQAEDFICNFEDGYSHKLSAHGTNISGGQKQRLLIARALAGKPQILILDDSSSALDYKTDAALRKALAENLQDTTVVTVAQRVSSVKDCTQILVLEQGAIIGMGTHEQLMDSCPEYKEISDSQMGGDFDG
jgi:ATP-binding cassette subfamily B protein